MASSSSPRFGKSQIQRPNVNKMAKKNSKKRNPTSKLVRPLLLAVAVAALIVLSASCSVLLVRSSGPGNSTTSLQASKKLTPVKSQAIAPAKANVDMMKSSPYHDWQLFATDFREMMNNMKIFIYPDVYDNSSTYAGIFRPHPDPLNPKLGNYLSEHMFKISLLHSSLITTNPENAHFFFLPLSINNLRNDRRVHSEAAIADFVANYVGRISREFKFWNSSSGADHFYVFCHSVGREAASKHSQLHNNAIQVTCSSSYFQKLYIAHKDVGLPQVWPRGDENPLNPPHKRDKLAYFAGRMQNSLTRQQLLDLYGNDTAMQVFDRSPYAYEVGFRRSRFCLHVKGYEVNTARISDAIHYGCIPVIISNYYDLPFSNVLDWSTFSIIINHAEIPLLKNKLLAVTSERYLSLHRNLRSIRKHFCWHSKPKQYDSFYMTAYQLWLRRHINRLTIP